MEPHDAAAEAHPNIALVKYWGNRDDSLRIPSNGSISMTLAGLRTVTRVRFDPNLARDRLKIDRRAAGPAELARATSFLDHIRIRAGLEWPAEIESVSNFPAGSGLASSASAFAALAVAGSAAAGLELSDQELSRLARRGSGSACRSLFGGFVEWLPGTGDDDSYAEPISGPDHWALVDLVAVVTTAAKDVGSSDGHRLAPTSPIQAARVADTSRRLEACRQAIRARDFARLAEVVEEDSHLMHAVMQTSSPPLFYWSADSVRVMHQVRTWRQAGLATCYTLDAGANVHCLAGPDSADEVARRLENLPGVLQVLRAGVGDGPRLLDHAEAASALL